MVRAAWRKWNDRFRSRRSRASYAVVEPLEGRALLSVMPAKLSVPQPMVEFKKLESWGRRDRPHALGAVPVKALRNIVYRDVPGDRETLDVFRPSGSPPPGGWPVVIAIHGGGWRKFSKEQYEPTVLPLVKLGYIVVAPNYRLSTPRSPSWPVNFEAVRDSVRWVRTHSGEIGGNPDRIAAMGESAGGHLAALLGTYPDGPVNPDGPPTGVLAPGDVSARVQAVVDFYGPTDLTTLDAQSPLASGPIRQFLGGSPATIPSRFQAASPVSYVTNDDPPTLIVQGSADWLVLPSQSAELSARLTGSGVKNQLIEIPGASHGFSLRVGGRDLSGVIDRFLADAMPEPAA